MKILGQIKGEQTASELDEICFVGSPKNLRVIAHFLLKEADKIQNYPTLYGHSHLKDEEATWPENQCDLVVYNPDFMEHIQEAAKFSEQSAEIPDIFRIDEMPSEK